MGENSRPLISVVIPIFNAELYIEKCIRYYNNFIFYLNKHKLNAPIPKPNPNKTMGEKCLCFFTSFLFRKFFKH